MQVSIGCFFSLADDPSFHRGGFQRRVLRENVSQTDTYALTTCPKFQIYSEVAKKSVSALPGPTLKGTLGSRMGPGRAGMAPTSGPEWVRNAVKQSTG